MASRYWVGGAGTWNSSNTTNWSTTNGGSGGASVPTASDDVYFTSSSGSGTCTISGTVNCLTISHTTTGIPLAHSSGNIQVASDANTTVVSITANTAILPSDLTITLTGNPTTNTRTVAISNTVTNPINFYITAGGSASTVSIPYTYDTYIKTFNSTGFLGYLNNASVSITSSLTLDSGSQATQSLTIKVVNTSGTSSFNLNGREIRAFYVTGNGTAALNSNLSLTDNCLVQAGTLNSNNYTINCDQFVVYLGANANLGSSTINITPGINNFPFGVQPTSTITTSGATINLTLTGSTNRVVDFGNKTFGAFNIYNTTGTGTLTIGSGVTLTNGFTTNLSLPLTILFYSGVTISATNFTLGGADYDKILTLTRSSTGTFSLSKSSGTVYANYLNLSYCNATGGATWYAVASTDSGNNTGWIFTAQGSMTLLF